MQLIFIRHGESEANTGASRHHDSSLTNRGRAQMSATADFLAERMGNLSTWSGIGIRVMPRPI
jgi:broad specificity phosphatase PhoE